ncbi:hypothetical protein QBC37DRAFT_429616 [Rhypophila decipiens]|uniref:Integral membrane protein n=1 Tax=Rhypophila decipiens TaxID=261697 RepID=A0AAN6Y281_9PEZI|nr:hypothetical protein QBC37DRAFT_429616 [Rhypophila decipiens]
MSHPRDASGAPEENPYFPSANASSAPPPPLEPTGETLVASNTDVAATAISPTTEHPPRIPTSPAIPGPSNNPPQRAPPASQARGVPFRSVRNQPSAIRLRRLRAPSVSGTAPLTTIASNPQPPRSRQQGEDAAVTNRRRSSSEPLSPGAVTNPHVVNMEPMPVVPEGQQPPMYVAEGSNNRAPEVVVPRRFMMRRRRPTAQRPAEVDEDCYDSRVVDFLDVVDPEVATLSSITNIQNSLFVPSLGRFVNRRPTYDLSSLPFIPGAFPASKEDISSIKEEPTEQTSSGSDEQPYPVRRTHSISTVLTSTPQYAIIPEDNDPGHSLEGWSEEDIKLLNDHVRHLLHSRRSKVKQSFKAFGKYARRPLGFFVTLYATLITLFGLAWVLFLIGWIYVGEKQLYAIEVIDQVLVALFAVMGDGLIPWRLYDTYNFFWINHFHRRTLKLRKKLLLPKLEDKNDLPVDPNDPSHRIMVDLEAQRVRALKKKTDQENEEDQKKDDYFPVLSDEEQAKLVKYQTKFAKSHTYYKPHETSTHRAFPHRLAMTIILLLDLHSCLQLSLGCVTWSIPYERRPAAATTTILCCSITVNALAGILISVGDRRTRKKDVVERLVRMELTGEVMEKMVKEKQKEAEREKEKEMEGSRERSKSRSRSRNGRVSEEGRSGRRSLDALTSGFKRKSMERRRSENCSDGNTSSSGSSFRKEKEKVGRFDPSTGPRKSMSGADGGLGVVAEADHEPNCENVLGYERGEVERESEMKIPGAFQD